MKTWKQLSYGMGLLLALAVLLMLPMKSRAARTSKDVTEHGISELDVTYDASAVQVDADHTGRQLSMELFAAVTSNKRVDGSAYYSHWYVDNDNNTGLCYKNRNSKLFEVDGFESLYESDELIKDGRDYYYYFKIDHGWEALDVLTPTVTINGQPADYVYRVEDGNLLVMQRLDYGSGAAPEITKQPRDWYGKIGKKATFTIEATGSGLHYSWQYKKDDKWYNYNITTSDTPEFKVTMNEKNIKWPIRCVITDANGTRLKSKVVYLKDASTSQPITITSQPADFYGKIGKKALFSVKATGNGLSYQWQYKKGTGAWTNYAIATADTANFSVAMNEKNVKWLYRCLITDEDGYTITTNEVKMLLEADVPFAITAQPTDFTGTIGKKASFSVAATGAGLSYQWQYKKGTADWTDYAIATADTANFSVTMNEKNVKWLYRCRITNGSGEVLYTNEVRMKVKEAFAITQQPGDWTGRIGKKATFTVMATGEGLIYQWQYKKGTTWANYDIASATTATLQVSANDKTMKWAFRCIITDAEGHKLTTNEVKMMIVGDWSGDVL